VPDILAMGFHYIRNQNSANRTGGGKFDSVSKHLEAHNVQYESFVFVWHCFDDFFTSLRFQSSTAIQSLSQNHQTMQRPHGCMVTLQSYLCCLEVKCHSDSGHKPIELKFAIGTDSFCLAIVLTAFPDAT